MTETDVGASDRRLVFPIRYDGNDATDHLIDLNLLGQSMQGAARILAVVSHFAVTQQYAKQMQALDVKVLASEPKANCFTIGAVLEFAKEQQALSGIATVIVAPIITWIIAKASNNRTEMKALKDSLDKAVSTMAQQNVELTQKLLNTIDRMADSLRPSVVAAVAPVGKTCKQMRIGESAPVDEATAHAIREGIQDELTDERVWDIRITELDLETAAAKIRLTSAEDDEGRISAIITDPAIRIQGNAYLTAFSAQRDLRVNAKAQIRQGEINKLFISDSM